MGHEQRTVEGSHIMPQSFPKAGALDPFPNVLDDATGLTRTPKSRAAEIVIRKPGREGHAANHPPCRAWRAGRHDPNGTGGREKIAHQVHQVGDAQKTRQHPGVAMAEVLPPPEAVAG